MVGSQKLAKRLDEINRVANEITAIDDYAIGHSLPCTKLRAPICEAHPTTRRRMARPRDRAREPVLRPAHENLQRFGGTSRSAQRLKSFLPRIYHVECPHRPGAG